MRPKAFVLCFEAHRKDEQVWAVKQGRGWELASEVEVGVPLRTVYRGPTARQPKAFLSGLGVVRREGSRLVITHA